MTTAALRQKPFFLAPVKMNVGALLLIFAGITLVLANELVAARQRVRIRWRYLPRDLDTYLREEPYASATFHPMFTAENLPYPRAAIGAASPAPAAAPAPPAAPAPLSTLG